MKNRFYEARLLGSAYTNDRTKHFAFELANGSDFDYEPGQFIAMAAEFEGRQILRDYSIASSPHHDNRFELCLNIIPEGRVSAWLFGIQPGDKVEFCGPFGMFTLRQPLDPVSAFIATGTGIAPIRAMLQYLYHQPGASLAAGRELWLIFGVRGESDILYRAEFEKMARDNSGFHFIPTLSRPGGDWQGHTGYVQKQVRKYLAAKQGFHAYICGLKKMVDDVRLELQAMGYGPKSQSYEKYD
ncbi:MAG TPA: FAD-dependent oxidoreductase [Terriglobia bacterium]|nr:FAD-dependent oxidoreductase [Terriglobia bacterium]